MKFSREVENLIANLRSLPEDKSRSNLRQSYPIDSLIEVILKRYKIGKPTSEETIMAHWTKIMGEDNAHRCSPQRLDEAGTLLVAVNNPVLRRELMFQRAPILKKIQALSECAHIKAIVFMAG